MKADDRTNNGLTMLQQNLGYIFSDPKLLENALTHKSYSYERGEADDYERLEFLGDSILGFVVSDYLMKADPLAPEGTLTRRKQLVVQTKTLARTARGLGLGEALRLGRGELGTGGRHKPSLLADVFEAVLGAVYLDGGLRKARAFVRRHLKSVLAEACSSEHVSDDFKTRFQESVQSRLHVTPVYRIVSSSGPDHALTFHVEVVVGREVWGNGRGSSRKHAEQLAAKDALRRLDQMGKKADE